MDGFGPGNHCGPGRHSGTLAGMQASRSRRHPRPGRPGEPRGSLGVSHREKAACVGMLDRSRPLTSTGPDVVVPGSGEPVEVRMDGQDRAFWWGTQSVDHEVTPASLRERAATCGSWLLTWPDALACGVFAARAGWRLAGGGDPAVDGPVDVLVIDAGPVLAWLRGLRSTVDPEASLTVWNFADDLAYSLKLPSLGGSVLADECYLKLFIANMPWSAGDPMARPRWNPRQLSELRRIMDAAVRLLRSPALTPHLPSRRSRHLHALSH